MRVYPKEPHPNEKAAKSKGCLEAANEALRAANRALLKRGDAKLVQSYRDASKDYRKKRTLLLHSKRNASLERFVDCLAEISR